MSGKSQVGSVVIVGGGIGGVALALALQKAGIPCTIFEQAEELREVGSGVGLWCNAVRVLERLGVGERLRAIGLPMRTVEVSTRAGKTLNRIDLSAVAAQFGGTNYIVHRAELHRAMTDTLLELAARPGAAPLEMKLGVRVEGLEARGGEGGLKRLRLSDGSCIDADLLVGADGIHSRLRAALWGERTPDYSGETCWRLAMSFPGYEPRDTFREIQGIGLRAGICPLPNDRLYVWLTAKRPFGEKDPALRRAARLAELFAGWPNRLPELIAATEDDAVLRTDLCDRPPLERWSQGNVTLLGDAAHPTTPNLGMGACMAIEDGMALTRQLLSNPSLGEALAAYEAERVGRSAQIVRLSRFWGWAGQWENALAVWFREQNMRLTPSFVQSQMTDFLYGYDAGDLPH